LQVNRGARSSYILVPTIALDRAASKDAFWTKFEPYGADAVAETEQRFRDGTYRFVKVHIVPVEDDQ
ncbi:MAG: hypothetical protein ACRC52_07485, partial [Aeromonas veronii]